MKMLKELLRYIESPQGYRGSCYITLDYFTVLSKRILENTFIGIVRKPYNQSHISLTSHNLALSISTKG